MKENFRHYKKCSRLELLTLDLHMQFLHCKLAEISVHESDWRERAVACVKSNWKVLLVVASVSSFALLGLLIGSVTVSKNS